MSAKTITAKPSTSASPEFLPAIPMARRLGLSGKTLQRWAAAGHIKPRKISRKTVLFKVSEVIEYVESCAI
jgi:excisionase family DNA binding protein